MSQIKEILRDLKAKNFNQLGKDDRTYLLYDNIQEIVEFYIKKGHKAQNDVNELFERMENPKFAKTLLRILKTPEHSPVDLGMATVIANFLERRHANLDEDLVAQYSEAIDKILKKRIKKLSKKTELNKDLLKELLVIVAEPEAISNPQFIGIYVQRMMRKLYTLSKTEDLGLDDVDTMKKLFGQIFGKDLLNDVAINVLLERKEFIRNYNEGQKAMWNNITNFALDVLESNKKKELRELIEYYVMRRSKDAQKNNDSARRIQFSQISEEDYPKLVAVAAKLSEKDKYKNFL